MEHVTVKDILEAARGSLLFGNVENKLNKICLDSRKVERGDLFVPIIGEKVDGHRFLLDVIERGAGAVLTSEHDSVARESLPEGADCAWIRVDDTKKALQDVGRYLRDRLTLPLIGVTGSVGKTTTREMIASALSAGYRVYRTPGNSNSQVGVPITISEISENDQVGVIELGMSEPGELTVIAKLARIDIAVITNVGITHIEQLGSRERIFQEKMSVQDGLKKGGLLILNGDDDMLREARPRDDLRVVRYGLSEQVDYRAEEIVHENGGTVFTVASQYGRTRIRLAVPGDHNVMNALAAVAVCAELGMTMEQAAEGLLSFTGFSHRQQIYRGERFTVLDDSYNASPASMRAALDVFADLPGKRHIAVLADMKELGEGTLSYHREIGLYAVKSGISMAVTLGEASKALAEAIRGASEIPVVEFMNREEMTVFLEQEVKEGDCLLLKGSNSMGLFAAADRLIRLAGEERR